MATQKMNDPDQYLWKPCIVLLGPIYPDWVHKGYAFDPTIYSKSLLLDGEKCPSMGTTNDIEFLCKSPFRILVITGRGGSHWDPLHAFASAAYLLVDKSWVEKCYFCVNISRWIIKF
eukprot:TRINITY_DN44759_c0_g2_i1.p1 TRINITY_DN44759_c0_g2~~TRINITY_DN44759_c0_g2_i1.p1  ORF type:complete len:117 (+),score=11.48 TRINITY_DN44759_c0_g2_i1:325-675(+)